MINKLEVYTSLPAVPIIDFDDSEPIETDYIYLIDPDGLGPVKASISGMDSGARDGMVIVGSSVPNRNIILTLRTNPDWDSWTPNQLAQVIYSYFTPRNYVKLVFDSDELGLVTIDGIVESCEPNRFTKDPEYQISIICPDPHFISEDSHLLTYPVTAFNSWLTGKQLITYDGNIPIGFNLKILATGFNADVILEVANAFSSLTVPSESFRLKVDSTGKILEINTVPGKRYVRLVDPTNGTYIDIMDSIVDGSKWPLLYPGDNSLCVSAGSNVTLTGKTWNLTYFNRYGAI